MWSGGEKGEKIIQVLRGVLVDLTKRLVQYFSTATMKQSHLNCKSKYLDNCNRTNLIKLYRLDPSDMNNHIALKFIIILLL